MAAAHHKDPSGGPFERGHELDRLAAVLDDARHGRGRRLVVVGPPGIGKSRLLLEAGAQAKTAGMTVLSARAGALERDYPFGVALRLLEKRFVHCGDDERARLVRGRAGLASSLLGGADPGLGALGGADEFALVHGLYWAVVNLSEDQPVALLVDDAHWADDLSVRFLTYLGQRLEDLPVALLLAFRDHDDDDETHRLGSLSAVPGDDYLRPAELTAAAVGRIFASADLPVAQRAEMVDAAWKATRGNPFLVHEVVAALRQAPQRWAGAPAADLTAFAPEAVTRSVVARLTQLGPDALKLARTAAMLGDNTSMAVVAPLTGLAPEAAAIAAHRLVARTILAGTETSTFHHPVIRAAVYDDIPATARATGHSAAARALHESGADAAEVARHIVSGIPTQQRWAHEVLHDAGRAAIARGAPEVAVRFLRRAVEWSAPSQRDAAMLVDLGLAEAASGHVTSLRRFEEALAKVGDNAQQSTTLFALGQTLHRYGRHAEAAAVFRRGTELFARDPDQALVFEGGLGCSAAFMATGRAEAIGRLEALCAPLTARAPHTDAERTLLAALAVQRSLADTDLAAAVRLAELALDGHPLLSGASGDDMGFSLIIATLIFSENATRAAQLAELLLTQAQRRGSGLMLAEASFCQAMVSHRVGQVDDALIAAEVAVAATAGGWSATVPVPHAILVDSLLEIGDLPAAERLIASGEMEPAGPEASGLNAWFHWARGRVRLARRDPVAALADFLAAGRDLEPFGALNPALLPWRSDAARAAQLTGDSVRAATLVDDEIELARDRGLHGALGAALRVRSLGESGERAQTTLDEAIAVLEKSDRHLVLARALFDRGRSARVAGERVAAREPLRRALDIAHHCGAAELANQVRAELLAAGARPRRAAETGPQALTASERRIAELAAAGHSNRMIAESLLLAKNTVEWHLRAVFRKLAISHREQLTEALASR